MPNNPRMNARPASVSWRTCCLFLLLAVLPAVPSLVIIFLWWSQLYGLRQKHIDLAYRQMRPSPYRPLQIKGCGTCLARNLCRIYAAIVCVHYVAFPLYRERSSCTRLRGGWSSSAAPTSGPALPVHPIASDHAVLFKYALSFALFLNIYGVRRTTRAPPTNGRPWRRKECSNTRSKCSRHKKNLPPPPPPPPPPQGTTTPTVATALPALPERWATPPPELCKFAILCRYMCARARACSSESRFLVCGAASETGVKAQNNRSAAKRGRYLDFVHASNRCREHTCRRNLHTGHFGNTVQASAWERTILRLYRRFVLACSARSLRCPHPASAPNRDASASSFLPPPRRRLTSRGGRHGCRSDSGCSLPW